MKKIFYILLALTCLLCLLISFGPGFFVLEKSNDSVVQEPTNEKTIVYLINMDVSTHRLKHIMPYIKELGLDFERIPGVYGNKLSDTEINVILDKKEYQQYATHPATKGMLGCSLSHLEAWQRFIKSDYKYALILEDDIQFDPQLLSKVIKELTSIAYHNKWDTVTLLKNSTGDTLSIATVLEKYNLNLIFKNISGTNAYIINRKAAKSYIEYFFPIKVPVDLYYSRAWEFGIKFLSLEPFIVHHANFESESGRSAKIDCADKVQNWINGPIFRQKTKMIRILYNLKVLLADLF